MSVAPTSRSTQVIDVALLDAPELDARLARDPEKLEELTRDILRRGLIEPIKVFAKGDRYEVIDGFRRFLATKHAGLTSIECFVFPSKTVALEGMKFAANAFREDMSPADEAIMFFSLLRDECGGDIEQLAALVNKKISYIDNRLALVNGDELVFEAVKDRQITLGVASELNALPDDSWRRYYLKWAVTTGATVSVVRGWVAEWKSIYGARGDTPEPAAPMPATSYVSTYDPMKCVVCQVNDPRQIPETISVHAACKVAILDKLLAAYRGEA